jgi:hypothetical protein
VDQVTEIVGEAGEQANFGGHDISVIWIERRR